MLAFANAKINLGLHVTEKREDGYHNLETVFYPVNLSDVVEITDSAETVCVVKGLSVPGATTDNLCLKAYELLKQDFDLPAQQITLLKHIPIGAGLGGGSSDAAFLVKLLNTKFDLGLSVSQLEDYAKQLGADCAFFIRNKPVYAEERGDVFSPVHVDLSGYFMALVKPATHISTAIAFSGLIPRQPAADLRSVLQLPVENWPDKVINDFEPHIFVKYPEIALIKEELYAAGATFALMSGSGASVYGLFKQPPVLPQLEKKHAVFYPV